MNEPADRDAEAGPRTMRAIVVFEPGGIDKLVATDLPVPPVRPGWVRIKVKAFGVNESEVTTRRGLSGHHPPPRPRGHAARPRRRSPRLRRR
ncbi:hypothetical protein [Streptomyces sp. NPDC059957]|uniref:hypothetical protein n=1 Tax=unclassified Streptomyces TaxID=2593676 RepID=UPI0036511869